MSDPECDGDAWLDDYEEGSTTEEFIHRMKNGMLLWHPDTDAKVIARETLRQAESREQRRSSESSAADPEACP